MIKSLQKVFHWFNKSQKCCKNRCKALVILSKGGLPLVRLGNQISEKECLEGGFLTAITMFSKECFRTEINQIITSKNQIFIRRTKNFIGYLIIKGTNKTGMEIAKSELSRLLNHLESAFDKEDLTYIQPSKVELIITQYANFIAEVY